MPAPTPISAPDLAHQAQERNLARPVRPGHSMVQMQNAVTGTGNGVSLRVLDMVMATLQVFGTSTTTIVVEGTLDGANWVALQVKPVGSPTGASSITADGIYSVFVAGLLDIRARISVAGGTVYVIGNASSVGGVVTI